MDNYKVFGFNKFLYFTAGGQHFKSTKPFLFQVSNSSILTGGHDAISQCWHPHLLINCVVWKHLSTRQKTSGQKTGQERPASAKISTEKGREDIASCTRLQESDQNMKTDLIFTSQLWKY